MSQSEQDAVVQILREKGPLELGELLQILHDHDIEISRKELNSMLYGVLKNFVTKDVDSRGQQIWKASLQKFTATKGLEFTLFKTLLEKKILTTDTAQLDYVVTNRRNRKVYHLDIAIGIDNRKLNIEVDGWDHLRADAMYSIQKQIREKGKNAEIDIDWMDHERSFIDFKSIDADAVYSWCMKNASWCRRFHEELLWPKDISRNLYLIENGWEIMRVWNFEVRADLNRVVKEIEEWIGNN